MITRAVADLKHRMDQQEERDVVSRGQVIQDSFQHSVIPFAKTYPMTDLSPVVAAKVAQLMLDADEVIGKMKFLINDRAEQGDGAAILILYRNLHAVVQCKLTMYRWQYGLTEEVISMTENDMASLIQIWVPVVKGLERMSDNSFSPGILYFHVGGHGRPEFTKYSYYYKGKAQPGSSSNMAPVSQAFIAARKAGRSNAIPQELFEWNKRPYEIMQQLRELKNKAPEPPMGPAPLDSKSWYKIKTAAKPGMALDIVNDGNQQRDGKLQMAAEGNFSGQHWQFRPSKTSPGAYNLCTLWLGTQMCLDVYGDDKTRPHLAAAGNYSGQQWHVENQGNGTWRLSNMYSGTLVLTADSNGGELHLRDPQTSPTSQWNLEPIRPITESGFDL